MRRLRERRAAERKARADINDTQPIPADPNEGADRLHGGRRRPRTAVLVGIGGAVLVGGLAFTAIPALAGGGDAKDDQSVGRLSTRGSTTSSTTTSSDTTASAEASTAPSADAGPSDGTATAACPAPPAAPSGQDAPGPS